MYVRLIKNRRPTLRPKTSANPSTTTRRHFYAMSSSMVLLVQMEIPKDSRASRNLTLDLSQVLFPVTASGLLNVSSGEHCVAIFT